MLPYLVLYPCIEQKKGKDVMVKNFPYQIRKIHRYLGLLIGFQFLMWTMGGLYFSWSDLDEIHGDHQRKPPPLLRTDFRLVSPQVVLDNLSQKNPRMAVSSLQVIDLLGQPVYQIIYQEQADTKTAKQIQLADALTGKLRNQLSEKEAISIAQNSFNGQAAVEKVEFLKAVDTHHEYRESPLPAYAVSFTHPSRTTVYVAAKLGTVQKFRNTKWRYFDFLWMLHTMDYSSRDNFGNLLLRAFSVMGLFTILSGFVLYYISSPSIRKVKNRLNQKGE